MKILNAAVNNVGLHLENVFINFARLEINFPLLFSAKGASARGPNIFIRFDDPFTPWSADSPVINTSNEWGVRDEGGLS